MNSVNKMVLVPYTSENCNAGQTKQINDDMIIQTIPKKFRSKAKMILEYIKDSISWTDKGEMVIRGEIYPETHIADLVRYSVREYGKYPPKDYEIFQDFLKELNAPKGLIQQQKTNLPINKTKDWLKL